MHVHAAINVAHAHKAFHALTSREGAPLFRDIGEYTEYERKGAEIHLAYPTLWGLTRVVLKPRDLRVAFEGSAPLGVSFGGSWTYVGTQVVLEQTVRGLPWFARGTVEARVARALEDLARAAA
jgi:hypothetical protein